jgi:hypothetical protein
MPKALDEMLHHHTENKVKTHMATIVTPLSTNTKTHKQFLAVADNAVAIITLLTDLNDSSLHATSSPNLLSC